MAISGHGCLWSCSTVSSESWDGKIGSRAAEADPTTTPDYDNGVSNLSQKLHSERSAAKSLLKRINPRFRVDWTGKA